MNKRKVLLIGWDAADWKMINPLLAEGKMPNLQKLIDEGVSGNIATLRPILSPTLWTSIATGKRPYKHGIHGFSEPDPVTGLIRPVTNLSRKTKAIWNILNQEDKDTITVGWWPSHPVEELSKGVMVSNDYHKPQGKDRHNWPMKQGTIHPQRLNKLLKELRFHPSELSEEEIFPFLPGIKGFNQQELDEVSKDQRVNALSKIIADCTTVHSAATALLQNEQWDLVSVYYDAIDHFGHGFMKYHPPQQPNVSDRDYRIYNYVNEAGYIYHDMMLGTLMHLAGEDTTTILLSDHGFHPDSFRLKEIPIEPAGPAAEHRQFGIFCAKGPGIKKGEKIYGTSLLDITPTLLSLFGLPIGLDMDGKILSDIYENAPKEPDPVESWDLVVGNHGMHSPDKQISPEDSKVALEQLISLGYIDELDEDHANAIDETVRELDYNLAQSYLDGGIFNRAAEILEKLYDKWPLEHRFGYQLATCYQSQNYPKKLRSIIGTIINRRLEEAKKAREEILSLELHSEEKKKAEKVLLEKMDKKEKRQFALKRNKLISKASPNFLALNFLSAHADFAEKKFKEALIKLSSLDNEVGPRQDALCLRGNCQIRLRQWKEAECSFTEALSYDEESPAPINGLTRIALAQRDFDKAILLAERSLSLIYFQPQLHYVKGLAHTKIQQNESAKEAFLQCIKQAPLFLPAYRQLAQIAKYQEHDPVSFVYFTKKLKEARSRAKEIKLKKQAVLSKAKINAVSGERQQIEEDNLPSYELVKDINANEIVTIVSGLPRSGTSLMMQILEHSGIKAFSDKERVADQSNRKGYFEHKLVKKLISSKNRQWVTEARGKSLKVVAPLLHYLPRFEKQITKPIYYRVIFMERDMNEVLKSQKTMLNNLGNSISQGDKNPSPEKAYIQQVKFAKEWCKKFNIPAISISFNKLLNDNNSEKKKLFDAFPNLSEEDIENVVDTALYRSK